MHPYSFFGLSGGLDAYNCERRRRTYDKVKEYMKSPLPLTLIAFGTLFFEFLSIPHFSMCISETHIKADDGDVPHGSLH